MAFLDADGVSNDDQAYDPTPIINEIRDKVATWRRISNPSDWAVTPTTQRLLQYWRSHEFQGIRPFFCQVEAVETIIWLTEVARKNRSHANAANKNAERRIWDHIESANAEANPELLRLAMKMATGAGKTTVMAMLIAWQTANAVRSPASQLFTRGFLLIAPGITIRDRLRVLLPSDTESYYKDREIVPADMLTDIGKAKIVITNYHAFQLKEKLDINKVGRSLLQGRGDEIQSKETEGEMVRRVADELMGLVSAELPVWDSAIGITGHSMGGHGALTLAMKYPDLFRSVSAFAPIVNPTACPWGEKTLGAYLGGNRKTWEAHDACHLVRTKGWARDILIDQGSADGFLEEQLKPWAFDAACREAGVELTLRLQGGYDHSYYFVSTFLPDHMAWHAERLTG